MKCVNCGADVSGSKCEYCGTYYGEKNRDAEKIKAEIERLKPEVEKLRRRVRQRCTETEKKIYAN